MTVNNAVVTVFFFNNENNSYEKRIFENVSIEKTISLSAQKGSLELDNSVKVRIFTQEDLNIQAGDLLYPGRSEVNSPNRAECFKIILIKDNRKKLFPHFRVECR